MKSGKAKKIIRETDLYISVQGVMFQDSRAMMKKDAIKAVEIAEQEAEERMRKKAIGAFDDMWFENGEVKRETYKTAELCRRECLTTATVIRGWLSRAERP